MSRKNFAGTWEGAPNYRWTRMVKGVRWRLLCRSHKEGDQKPNTGFLGLPEHLWTKLGSQDKANEWWEQRKETIFFDETWSNLLTEKLRKQEDKFQRSLQRLGVENNPVLENEIFRHLDSIKEAEIEDNQKLAFWKSRYLELKRGDKQRTTGRYDNLQRSVTKFVGSIGVNRTVADIDELAWENFYKETMSVGSAPYQSDIISDCRGFVRYLYEQRQIPELPRNLSSLKVAVHPKKIQYFTKAQLNTILNKSTEELRLFVWLFANCGFRQKDVATLTDEMFDGKYITRKRSKTENHANVPEVSWILWDETKQLIKKHRQKKGLMFLQANGKPWVFEGLNENNRRSRDDNFRDLWRDFMAIYPMNRPSADIRKSCANMLPTFSIQIKYLGQSPSGVTLQHYVDPPQADLDKAILKLRNQILG